MNNHRGGFTIIELLLALALTSLLTAALSVMIGQAARERQAMLEQTHDPAWSLALTDIIERDLCQAQWWAGAEDRLVLIGLGRDGLPAQIEYRWVVGDTATALTRTENPLTDAVDRDNGRERVLAIGLRHLQVGPHRLGEAPSATATQQPTHLPAPSSSPALLIKGRQVPLQPLPDVVTIIFDTPADALRTIRREVVLR